MICAIYLLFTNIYQANKKKKKLERVHGESIDSITLKKYFVRRKSRKQNIRLVSIPFETRTCHLWRTLIATTTTTTTTFISEHPRSRHDKIKFLSREGHTAKFLPPRLVGNFDVCITFRTMSRLLRTSTVRNRGRRGKSRGS